MKMRLIYYLLIFGIVFMIGCSSPVVNHVARYDIRRSPPMNNIDPGIPTEKMNMNFSLSYQYSSDRPDVQEYSDTAIGTSHTYVNNTYLFESRHAFSGDIAFTFTDFLSMGMVFDISFGDLSSSYGITDKKILNNNLYEWSIFVRLISKFDKFTIGFRPEMLFYTANCYTSVFSTSVLDTIVNSARDSYHGITIRNTVFARYTFFKMLSIFLGFQYKRQPFTIEDRSEDFSERKEELLLENTFGMYTGLGAEPLPGIHLCPYISIPFGTELTDYRSPVQGGIKIVMDVAKLVKE